jgi:hypothetical protein
MEVLAIDDLNLKNNIDSSLETSITDSGSQGGTANDPTR